MVTHIDEKGFLRFAPVGGLSAHEVLGAPVRFANGVKGVVALEGKVEAKEMKLEHLYVDIGAKDEAEARSMVQVGDVAVYDTAAFQSGSRIFSPYLDDRIACVVLLMAMERLGETDNDLTFAFTVQEEVGLRGAKTAAYGWAGHGIAVDVTDSDDIPEPPTSAAAGGEGGCHQGDGQLRNLPPVVVKAGEAGPEGIPVRRTSCAGGTDAGAIHQSRAGVYTGASPSPPATSTPPGDGGPGDIEACAALVAAFAQSRLD